MCRVVLFVGSQATSRFEKHAWTHLELILCVPALPLLKRRQKLSGYYYCRIPASRERFGGR
jgi:hypothetical protein